MADSYDVAIVGEGINGAGVARDAAMRGLRTALVERGDFACGTSSRSSKLIHGGLRYLEQGHVRLVLEAPLGRLRVGANSTVQPWEPERFSEILGSSNGAWACLMDDFVGKDEDAGAIRAVVQYAAESRARGVLRQWSEFARRRPNASPLRLRALNGAPWDPSIAESMLGEIRDAILWTALSGRLETGEGRWASFSTERSGC